MDYIENLVGLCGSHHDEAERNDDFNEELKAFAKHAEPRKEWMMRKMMEEI